MGRLWRGDHKNEEDILDDFMPVTEDGGDVYCISAIRFRISRPTIAERYACNKKQRKDTSRTGFYVHTPMNQMKRPTFYSSFHSSIVVFVVVFVHFLLIHISWPIITET